MKKLIQNENGGAGLWAILAIAIGIAAFFMLRQPVVEQLPVETATILSEEDTTAVIENELQLTDLGDLEADINSLDIDINQL